MNTYRTLLSVSTAFFIGLALCAVAPPARAAIEWSGNVEPLKPGASAQMRATWWFIEGGLNDLLARLKACKN
ncbi:MAG: hypothetical protein KAT11_00410 [Phycisphaerae bacterium]|nr:hypothetical protein [Phycisphaerae bacterium]